MRRAAEIGAFLGLSAVVHAGVVAGLGTTAGGAPGQGADGPDRVTLQAAPESLAALADRWTTAPDAALTPVALLAPAILRAPPLPSADSVPPRATLPPLPQAAAAPAPPDAQDPAPRLSRPTLPSLPSPPGLPRPEAVPTAPTPRDTAPNRHAPPILAAPQSAADPDVATAEPPPPGTSALASATSPRPPQRPFEPEPAPRQTAAVPPSAAPSAPQPARVAAGTGGAATQGATAVPTQDPATLSAARRQSLMAQWGGQIMARIERARPRVRGSGQVVLALQVLRSGQLAGLSVARSSGDPALDEAALSAVRRAGSFPAAPEGLTEARYGFSLPIRFR